MLTDLRQALRGFGRTPGVTAAAVLSLALGIGANTAIFSVAWAILAKPLPYKNAERLAILWNRSPGLDILEDWFSTAQYFDIATRTTSFETLAIALGANYNLTDADREPERVGGIRVSSNLLPMLGAAPLHDADQSAIRVDRRRRRCHRPLQARCGADETLAVAEVTRLGRGDGQGAEHGCRDLRGRQQRWRCCIALRRPRTDCRRQRHRGIASQSGGVEQRRGLPAVARPRD